jgi:hypothetical protein
MIVSLPIRETLHAYPEPGLRSRHRSGVFAALDACSLLAVGEVKLNWRDLPKSLEEGIESFLAD